MSTDVTGVVQTVILAVAQMLNGSVGASILLVSAGVRLALLPLALRGARYAQAQQRQLAAIKPRLDELNRRFAKEPARLLEETQALYRKHGIEPFSVRSFASGALQFTLLGALFAAVRRGLGARTRFLWIADLTRADGLLILMASAIAALAASVAPSANTQSLAPMAMAALAAGLTLLFLWSSSSAVALSVGAGSAVSLVQSIILRRESRRVLSDRG